MPYRLEREQLLQRLRYINQKLREQGQDGLGPEEIGAVLQQLHVPTPINGLGPRVFGDQADEGMTAIPEGSGDALFRSDVPMHRAIGPVINPMQRNGTGATGMTGLYDDQQVLGSLRTRMGGV